MSLLTKANAKPIAPEIIQDDRPDATPPKSKGERVFDRVVYAGLAGVVTFFVTPYIADKLKNARLFAPIYKRCEEGVAKVLGRFLAKDVTAKVTEEVMQTGTLMMGGNAMLLPIGIAEHYKQPLVAGLNVTLGDDTPKEQIAKAPQQTAGSLIEGRLLAFFAVLGALLTARFGLPGTYKTYLHEVGARVHQATSWMTGSTALTGKAMRETRSYTLGRLGAVDVLATAAAATILYIGGHFFARKHEEKKAGQPEGSKRRLPLSLDAEPTAPMAPEAGGKERPATAVTSIRAHEGQLSSTPQLGQLH